MESLAETNGTTVQNLIFDIWLINRDFCSVTIMSKQNEIWFASAMMIFYSSLVSLQARCSHTREAASKWLFPLWWTVMRVKKGILNKTYLTFCMRRGAFSFILFFLLHLNKPPLGKIKILTMLLFVITFWRMRIKKRFINSLIPVRKNELMLWATQGFVNNLIFSWYHCWLSLAKER